MVDQSASDELGKSVARKTTTHELGLCAASVRELGEARRRGEKERMTSTNMNLQTRRRTKAIEEVAWRMQRNFIGDAPV
jgi:hypothetical protein